MFDENKIALCYPNYTGRQDCVLAGGNWLESLPLVNLKNRVIQKRGRTVDTSMVSTKFSISLGEAKPVLCIALAGHNFSGDARLRISIYDDADKSVTYYQSPWVDAWPALDQASLQWEDNNFWTGEMSPEERQSYVPLFTHFIDAGTVVPLTKYITVEIDDQANPDGFVQIGRLFFSDVWQPTRNASLGLAFKYNSTTEIESTIDNTEYFDVRKSRRSVSFTLDRMPVDDAYGRLFKLQRLVGTHGEVLFAYTPKDTLYAYERKFLGRLQELDPISEPYVDRRHQSAINLIELI